MAKAKNATPAAQSAAGKKATGKKKAAAGHTVIKPFRDRNNFDKEYVEGDDVSHFDADRLAHLVKIGHVEAGEAVEVDEDTDPPQETEEEKAARLAKEAEEQNQQ